MENIMKRNIKKEEGAKKTRKKGVQKDDKVYVSVLTKSGEDTGRRIELEERPFLIEPHKHILHLYIVNFRHHQRQGTAKTKEKSEVSKSTKKLYKQKHTGNARAGSAKSGVRRGGGTIHGPRPRDYGFKMNKKEKRLARQSALSIKVQKKQIMVVEDFAYQNISTKDYINLINTLSIGKEKNLWVFPSVEKNIVFSAKNVEKNKITTVDLLNGFDLLHATKVICLESAIPLIIQKLA